MPDFVAVISSNVLISGIRAAAALLFLIALFYTGRIYKRTKNTTDIWLLISFALLVAFLVSLLKSLGWYFARNTAVITIGEQLGIIFSLVWIYIAFRFLSIKKIEGYTLL